MHTVNYGEDTKLIPAARQGDRKAWSRLLEKYRPLLLRGASKVFLMEKDDARQEMAEVLTEAVQTCPEEHLLFFAGYLKRRICWRMMNLNGYGDVRKRREIHGLLPERESAGGTGAIPLADRLDCFAEEEHLSREERKLLGFLFRETPAARAAALMGIGLSGYYRKRRKLLERLRSCRRRLEEAVLDKAW